MANKLGSLFRGLKSGAARSTPLAKVTVDGHIDDPDWPSDTLAALAIERQALRSIAAGAQLSEVLGEMALAIERAADVETLASILLTDEAEERLFLIAAPSLPDSYNQAVDGAKVGPRAGSCGTCVYRREGVFVIDIMMSPLWTHYEPVASSHGLRSCWSIPIKGADGRILGTFALYHRVPRAPSRADIERINLLGSITALAIERSRTEEALRKSRARCLELEAALAETA